MPAAAFVDLPQFFGKHAPLYTPAARQHRLTRFVTGAPDLFRSTTIENRLSPLFVTSSSARDMEAQTTVAPPPVMRSGPLFSVDVPNGRVVLGGHRGMGANRLRNGLLVPAWRENTLPSFAAAAATGASFVEFDVQVTRDGMPVLWHDNTLEYGDPARPTVVAISDLTLAEFEALGHISARGDSQVLSVVRHFRDLGAQASSSSSSSSGEEAGRVMRWRAGLDAPFPRLEQLFEQLPADLGFNIEVKMATPDELAVTPPEEVERMVAPILAVLHKHAGGSDGSSSGRPILLSSFDPDVCRELRARQSAWPVMFLSTGGRDWHADPRRMSITAALAVAAEYSLSGVVLDSGALAAEPEAVGLARAQGIKVVTYGLENDDPDWVLRQQQLGVFGVIVDDVARVASALPRTALLQPASDAVVAASPALARAMSLEVLPTSATAKVAAS